MTESQQQGVREPDGVFYLERDTDASGVSGTGRVAQGFEFEDGICALRWLTEHRSTEPTPAALRAMAEWFDDPRHYPTVVKRTSPSRPHRRIPAAPNRGQPRRFHTDCIPCRHGGNE